MGKISSMLIGAGLGAGLMYYLDPQNGNRRQALVRDRFYRLQSRGDDAIETAVRDLRNRARGVLAEGMAMVSEESVDDNILSERVRSRIGFFSRHPGAIQVTAQGQQVILSGDVLANEVEGLLKGIEKVRGVRGVQNNLRVHEEAGAIPQLQGEGWMPGDRAVRWSPSTRLLAGAGAMYLLLYGSARGGLIGMFARAGGLALGARALTNQNVQQMTGRSTDGQGIRVRKTININAPVEEVYQLWSNFENFPRFMANVESIRPMSNNRSHWVVKGPAGSTVEFDSIMTENIPNDRIAWETTPDSTVKNQGHVVFRPEGQRRTQVSVNMTYMPPAGVAGAAVAALFGKDPKTQMDEDLARLKTLLEEGKTRAEGQKVRKEEVMPVTGSRRERGPSGGASNSGDMGEGG